ncbi:MAG TPA: AMP-binding protein [Vicinamibacterales bacterium]|nr:AMP-binding protein [Vicinamibacterales bacterium]
MTDPHRHEVFAGIALTADGADSGESEFSRRPELEGHLATAVFRSLARTPKREVIVDNYPERRTMNAATLLALSIALSRRWRGRLKGTRVGIALPPGIGAFAANAAVLFAGRIPVDLNFTIGPAAAAATLRKAGIETVISAPALREKVPDFPWPEDTLDIRAEINACGRASIAAWLIAIRLLPAAWLERWLALPQRGGDAEAALLFTSGSAGEPKGVVLTHRNIIGNCLQVRECGLIRPGDTMIGCLPIFHSFGFTVTLCYPMLHDARVATFPSPLETKRIAEIIAAERAQILIGAPTFLRPFLKRAEPEQMRSLRLVVAGAEKMPIDLYEGFLARFNLRICEGYGLTETSPVIAVNRPDPVPSTDGGKKSGLRLGSVGLMLTGMRARIVAPDTHEPLPPTETGVLAVQGCNVFPGYLDDPEATARVLRDGWFVTGDLARFDEEGFLYIEGRLSRFSKIGGEMVPHIAVEQKIIEVFGWQEAEAQPVVVVGVTDSAKGESLVALSVTPLDAAELRDRLTAAGLPNLWIPRRVLQVHEIPQLKSGKLDLRACCRLAEESGV